MCVALEYERLRTLPLDSSPKSKLDALARLDRGISHAVGKSHKILQCSNSKPSDRVRDFLTGVVSDRLTIYALHETFVSNRLRVVLTLSKRQRRGIQSRRCKR